MSLGLTFKPKNEIRFIQIYSFYILLKSKSHCSAPLPRVPFR